MSTGIETNFLSGISFRLVLKRAPHLQYHCQMVDLQDITLPVAVQSTPFVQVPRPGTTIQFTPLTLSFKVDETMANYLEIMNWMFALGGPESRVDYKTLSKSTGGQDFTKDSIVSDVSVIIESSNNNPIVELIYQDAFPTNLTIDKLDVTAESIEYLLSTVQFHYRHLKINLV